MLKITFAFALCLIATVWAAPAPDGAKEPVPIISQESSVDIDGKFHYSYESGDGSKATEDGELKQVDKENAGEAVHGSYEYQGDDGKTYHVEYTADEHGYIPHGDHIPQSIAKALQYIVEHEEPEEQPKH